MESTERAAMWTYIGVMVGFKLVTAIFILYFTHALGVLLILIALHVPWVVGALVLLGVPGSFWYRLIKVRRRRQELIRQEFLEDPLAPAGAHIP